MSRILLVIILIATMLLAGCVTGEPPESATERERFNHYKLQHDQEMIMVGIGLIILLSIIPNDK